VVMQVRWMTELLHVKTAPPAMAVQSEQSLASR
jgi:hypothetical protein